jgi:hypothetical protein
MDRNKIAAAVLALASAAAFAMTWLTASDDGWPSPHRHDAVLLVSAVLTVLLVVLLTIVTAIALRSTPPNVNVRTDSYLLPADPEDGDTEIKGKMPGTGTE